MAELDLTETEWWQVGEARGVLARWDRDHNYNGRYDMERVLADHLRAVLDLIPEGPADV